jgi:tetratricopeptide (TPR) repeat protein
MPKIKVLVSHAHDEKALAEAWKILLNSVSLGAVEVWFSSDVNPGGGMEIGKEWREQLHRQLAESEFIIAIQTPSSATRPWIMWECGLASGIAKERGIIPVVFSMGRGDLANPLTSYQVYQGEDETQVFEICGRLVQAATLMLKKEYFSIEFKAYSEAIKLHRPRKAVATEQMTLWRARFEELMRSRRFKEIPQKRQAMYESLGEPFRPIEPTVHELLSKVLLDHNYYKEAIEEIDYALALVGEDIDLLHRKALALAELKSLPEAENIINQILAIHKNLENNSELASLAGRVHREIWKSGGDKNQLDLAFEAYTRAYRADKTQYFPGINAASLALEKGDIDTANEIFGEVLKACQELQQRQPVSYWVDFTAGDVLLGMGDVEGALGNYELGLARDPAPPPRDKMSAFNGAGRMVDAKGLPASAKDDIKKVFRID